MSLAYLDRLLTSMGIAAHLRGLFWILVILALTLIAAVVLARILAAVERKLSANDNLWDDVFLHAARRPIYWYVWLQGVYWASEAGQRFYEVDHLDLNDLALKFGFIILVVWCLLRFVGQAEELLTSDRVAEPMDYTTVSAMGKLSRAIIIIIAALVIIQNLGYSISGVLAFGGVGGIAVGFAAKDMLANFFGGAVVYMDKPFKVGEWIRSPDASIEGVVEHIGWRITRIRTFESRPLYVPNAIFTTIAVENPSRMLNRRIYEVVGVRYGDVALVEKIVQAVRSMLESHEGIDHSQTLIVNFTAFNASSLDIMVYTFTRTRHWVEYHQVKEDILLRISGIIADHGAEVAFPTRTLHLEQSRSQKPEHAGLALSQSTQSGAGQGAQGEE
mgnify:FL=1